MALTEEALDIRERGGAKNGQPQLADKRLFMQFLAFGGCSDSQVLTQALEQSRIDGVLYSDIHDPHGVGLLAFQEDPSFFTSILRQLLNQNPFTSLQLKPEYSMLGRTYALGHEPDLEDWLLHKPKRTVLNHNWPWAVWYPLRRAGSFNALPPEEQMPILREHGKIGHSFGDKDLAHDIRLACFGLDKNDNDFIIGLIGKDLHPLSACVQMMRKTRQTSQYIQNMGPFFIGRAVWQSSLEAIQKPSPFGKKGFMDDF